MGRCLDSYRSLEPASRTPWDPEFFQALGFFHTVFGASQNIYPPQKNAYYIPVTIYGPLEKKAWENVGG